MSKKRTRDDVPKIDLSALKAKIPPSRSSSRDSQGRTNSMNELSKYLGHLKLNTNYSNSQPGLEIKPEPDDNETSEVSTQTQTQPSGGESKKSKKKTFGRSLFPSDDDRPNSTFQPLRTVTFGGKKRKTRRKRKKRRKKTKRRRKTKRKTKRRKKKKILIW